MSNQLSMEANEAFVKCVGSSGFTLYTRYQDVEFLSAETTNATGKRFQLWLEPTSDENRVVVKAWDFRKQKFVTVNQAARLQMARR